MPCQRCQDTHQHSRAPLPLCSQLCFPSAHIQVCQWLINIPVCPPFSFPSQLARMEPTSGQPWKPQVGHERAFIHMGSQSTAVKGGLPVAPPRTLEWKIQVLLSKPLCGFGLLTAIYLLSRTHFCAPELRASPLRPHWSQDINVCTSLATSPMSTKIRKNQVIHGTCTQQTTMQCQRVT